MGSFFSITVCIPLYNEEEVIHQLKENLEALRKKASQTYKITFLLVDDGSTDNTNSLLNELFSSIEGYKIIQHKTNLNLDGFLKTSINTSNSDYIAFLDSDSTFDPQLIIPMLDIATKNNFDIVNGSHLHPKGSTEGVTFLRKLISIIANKIYKFILKSEIYTFTSILKIYKLEKIKNFKIHSKGFVAVTELLALSILEGLKVIDYPCTLTTRAYGISKIKFFGTISNHLNFMVFLLKKSYLKKFK